MSLPPNPHRAALTEQAAAALDLYKDFPSNYRVSFSVAEPGPDGFPRIAAKLERPDGTPFAESGDPLDRKLAHLKDQTVIVRPFYLPKMRNQWDESDANSFKDIDFDYVAILGYGPGEDGGVKLVSLDFLPTDTLLDGRVPDEDGVWRDLRLATHFVSQLSLNPHQKYARFLYLAERMSEGLEYQFDTYGYFFSNQ